MCSIPPPTICWQRHLKNFCASGSLWILASFEKASVYILVFARISCITLWIQVYVLAILIRGEEDENLGLRRRILFPRFFCFSFLSEQPSSFSWHPTLHVKTSSIFSIGPLTDQSWTQILYNCGLFCGISYVFSILSLYHHLFSVQLWSNQHFLTLSAQTV